jgi:hypothetical protein
VLSEATGEKWTRGMVAALETGDKHFTVDLLLTLVRVQGFPAEFYLYGPSATVPNSANPGYVNSDLVIPEDFPVAA